MHYVLSWDVIEVVVVLDKVASAGSGSTKIYLVHKPEEEVSSMCSRGNSAVPQVKPKVQIVLILPPEVG
jgi:hypothetical protein